MDKTFFTLLLALSHLLGLSTADQQLELAVEKKVAQAKLPGMVAAITSSKGVLAVGAAALPQSGASSWTLSRGSGAMVQLASIC